MALAWTYKDGCSRNYPYMGSDEWCRHTLVIPNPFKVTSTDEHGDKYYSALVLVVAPWWLCRNIFDKEDRQDTIEARQNTRDWENALKELKRTKPFIWHIIQESEHYSETVVDAAYDEAYEIKQRLEK